MASLWLGVLLFGGTHVFSLLMPAHRNGLKARWGEKRYMGIYSLVSLAGLVLLGFGYVAGRGDVAAANLYEPWAGARHIMMLLVLVGFILIFSNKNGGYISRTLHHPFSIGVALWSLGHLLVNGEPAVVVIYGLFLALSLLDIFLGFARGKWATHVPNIRGDIRSVVVGLVLFAVFAFGFHPYVLQIPVM